MTDDDHYRGEVTQKAVVFGPSGEVLLVRSAAGPWGFPGGRIEDGEPPAGALRRELREETGLDVAVERPVQTASEVWYNAAGEPLYAVVYHCEAADTGVSLNHEHEEYDWVAPAEAAERLPLDVLSTAVERARLDRGSPAGPSERGSSTGREESP